MSDILFRIVIEDAGVADRQKQIREEIKKTNAEIKKVSEGAAEYAVFAEKLVRAKVEAANLRDRQRELNNEFKATRVPTDSLAGLRLEYAKLVTQVAALSNAERNSTFGKDLIKNTNAVKKEIDGVEQSLGRFTGNVGNYQSALGSFVSLAKNAIGPLAALAAAQKIITNNAAISDQVADVAKAADISIESVNRLADTLEKRLTRTSLSDQLGIAEIGGKLGVAEKDLFSFVDAIDVVNVALGDQFGGSVEATTDVLGKLRNVLTDIRTDNIGKDIQNIGNALNYLEAQGAASAGTIADFTGRIAGAGRNLGVTSAQIIGVSATLDELGVNAERGSSAYVRILQRVAASPAQFAKAAGVSAKDFTKLVNEDLAGAVNLFLSKINDQDLSNTELQKVLKTLKLDGVGTAETVGKLGQNMALLKERTTEAGAALKSTDSIQQEFEKKNQTLGAAVQNLSNAFFNLTTSSSIGSFISGIVQGVTSLITEISLATDKLFDFSGGTEGAALAQDILAESAEKAAEAIGKETVSTEKNFNLLKGNYATQQQRQKAIDDLIKVYPTLLTQQQLESANIEQLNGLQILATNVLREQVTERLKLRAKEQIESEIVQKQLRRAELEATPDRALLGTLTAGETFRNFGTLNPQKLRADLFAQYSIDIAQLEEQSRKVDENFNRIKIRAEDNLTAAEQDRLDLFRQFNDRGVSGIAATDKNAPGTGEAAILDKPSKIKKTKEEAEGAVGSIDFLREKIQKLTEAIDKSPEDAKLLSPLLLQLKQAEFQLAELQDRLDKLRNPKKALTEDQAIFDALGLPAPTDKGTSLSQREQAVGFTSDAQIQEEEARKQKLDELDNEYDKRHRERVEKSIEDEKKKREELKNSIIQAGEELAAAVFQIQANRIDNEENKALEALDKEYSKKIDAAQGNAAAVTQLEKEQAAKREQIEKEANEKRKASAKTEAIIQGAVAVVKALPNFILAALAAVTTAAQIAIIDSQQFAEGGFTGPGGSRDHTGHKVAGSYMKGGTRIVYHDSEYIAPKHQVERFPWLFQMLDSDRARKSRSFAEGGFTDFVPQLPGVGSTPQQQTFIVSGFSEEQEKRIAQTIAQEVARQTGEKVREGAAAGLDSANRLRERQALAEQNRKI